MEKDIYVKMPPIREYTVILEIKEVKKASVTLKSR